ncbi:MAG: FAD/NAD(P)-binding protein [Bacillota bacterium]
MCDCNHEHDHNDENHECECAAKENVSLDTLVPQVAVVTNIRVETPDVKTFRVEKLGGGICFDHMPGQCAMLTLPGVGEALFSITSSPTNTAYKEFSVKKCGDVTDALHAIEEGQQIGLRGPYGKPFPVETVFKGQNLLFVAGGIGLAPLRSVIDYARHYRDNYGTIDIVYGARSADDLVDYHDLTEIWPKDKNINVHVTIDRPQEGWTGNVGFVPTYLKELNFDTDRTPIVCGPPIMIKFVLAALIEMGFNKTQVYTTLELKMKCGVGKCGRCNIGSKYVCKDGPVFRCDEIDELPNEY